MKMRRLLEDTEKIQKTETQNFFAAVKNLHSARHAGTSVDHFIDELEIIALHTEQAFLRKRAQQIIAEQRAAEAGAEKVCVHCGSAECVIKPSIPAR